MRWSTAAGVGVIVVVAAAILVASFVLLESAGVIGNTYTVVADFPNAQGVTKGTEVRLAGVKIGEVEEVALSPGNRAELKLRILQKYSIPPDAQFVLASTGLLTAPVVEIVPAHLGPPSKGARHGVTPPGPEQLLPDAQKLLANLNDLSTSMKGLLGDRKMRQNLSRSAENIAAISERGKTIAANLQAASTSGRALVDRFQKTTGRLDQTAAMLQQTVGENRAKVGQTLTSVHQALTSVNDTMEALHGLVDQMSVVVSDPKVKGGLQGTVANIEQATAKLDQTSANLVKITDSVQKLSADQKLNEDLRATVSGLRATVEQSQLLMQRLNHIVGSGRKSVSGTRERGRRKLEQTEVVADLAMETSPGRPTLDVNAYLPHGDRRYYRLGLDDITERNKVNLQLGWPFLGNTVRYGLYQSRMGLGFDVGAPSHPRFSADLYSYAEPELDVRARANIAPDLDLTLGARSLLHRNIPTVGITWRK